MTEWIILIFALGAVARLTRLATADTITQPVRDAVLFNRKQRRARRSATLFLPAPDRPWAARLRAWLHSLITCPWCISMWIAALVSVLTWLYGDTTAYLVVTGALTLSYLTGWLAEHEAPDG